MSCSSAFLAHLWRSAGQLLADRGHVILHVHGGASMFARVVTFQRSSPSKLDKANDMARDQVLPVMRQQPGYRGVCVLSDRSSGKQLGISFWDTNEQALGSANYNTTRDRTSNELGDVVPPITEVFDVFDIETAPATDGCSVESPEVAR